VQLAGATGAVRAALVRGDRVLARGRSRLRDGRAALRLPRARVAAGRYTLRLRFTVGGEPFAIRKKVSVM
jgi:hypothetical protein